MRTLVFAILLLAPDFARAEMPLYFQEEERVLANKFSDGIMHVNGREFLMGDLHEWPKGTDDYSVDFMVRSSIWLRDFLHNDPVLMYQDFKIRRTRDSSFTGRKSLAQQMEMTPDPSRDCPTCYYAISLDPVLQVSGYETYANSFGSLKFVPKNSEVAHVFQCQLSREESQLGELSICDVTVVYPYATNIVLNGRRQWPGTVAEYGPSFGAIAERMLEVVTCIDVTGKEDFEPSAGISELLERHPNLTGCRIDLTG